jgi:hypothetical protein
MRQPALQDLESMLVSWFEQARGSNQWHTVEQKALNIAKKLGIDDFKASNGWIGIFLQLQSVVHKTYMKMQKYSLSNIKWMWKERVIPNYLWLQM